MSTTEPLAIGEKISDSVRHLTLQGGRLHPTMIVGLRNGEFVVIDVKDHASQHGINSVKALMIESIHTDDPLFVALVVPLMFVLDATIETSSDVGPDTPVQETVTLTIMREDLYVDTWRGIVHRGENGSVTVVDEDPETKPAKRLQPRTDGCVTYHDVYLVAKDQAS